MPQNAETGREGRRQGYARADQIARRLGALRIDHGTNEFMDQGERIVIKTGPKIVVTRPALNRVASVVCGVPSGDGRLELWRVDPGTFERNSVASRSRRHDERYRLVPRSRIRQIGVRVDLREDG